MIDLVDTFKTYAHLYRYEFAYGRVSEQNWILTKDVTLKDGESVIVLFPIIENANVANSFPHVWNASTQIWLGKKFDADNESGTFSQLDETDQQKWDRRLFALRSAIETYLKAVFCSESRLELTSARIQTFLNKFDENVDFIGMEISFNYDSRAEAHEKIAAGINAGESGGTDWIDSDNDDTPDLWEIVNDSTLSIFRGNGFIDNALRVDTPADTEDPGIKITKDANGGNVWEIGTEYSISIEYRKYTTGGTGPEYPAPSNLAIKSAAAQETIAADDNTGDAALATVASYTPDGTDLIIFLDGNPGSGFWFEIDEITITEV